MDLVEECPNFGKYLRDNVVGILQKEIEKKGGKFDLGAEIEKLMTERGCGM